MLEIAKNLLPWRRNPQESRRRFQASRVKGKVNEVLQREAFGEKQFNEFVDNMIRLVGEREERLSMVMIRDNEENKVINLWRGDSLTEHFATVRINPASDVKFGREGQGIWQEQLKYKVDPTTNERKPRLESLLFSPGKHDSYITGEKDMSERNQFLSDENVRSFCLRVFRLYQESQNLAQPQSQNNVG